MKIIEIIISPTGAATVQTKGFSGSDCLASSKFLEQSLGVTTHDNKTTEFYAAAENKQQARQ